MTDFDKYDRLAEEDRPNIKDELEGCFIKVVDKECLGKGKKNCINITPCEPFDVDRILLACQKMSNVSASVIRKTPIYTYKIKKVTKTYVLEDGNNEKKEVTYTRMERVPVMVIGTRMRTKWGTTTEYLPEPQKLPRRSG